MSNNLINFVSQRRLKTFLDKLFGVFISKAEYSNNMTHYDNRHTCYYNPTNLDFSKNYVMLCEDITSPEDIANSVWTANYNNEVFEFSPEIISEFSWLENYQCYFCTFKTPLNYKIDDPDKLIELQCLVFPKPYQSITEPGIYITTENLSSYAIINSEIEFSIGELKQIDDKYIPNTVIRSSEKGLPNGVATLNDNGKINIDQLPDDIGLGGGLNEVDWETDVINKPFYDTRIESYYSQEETPNPVSFDIEMLGLSFYKISDLVLTKEQIFGSMQIINEYGINIAPIESAVRLETEDLIVTDDDTWSFAFINKVGTVNFTYSGYSVTVDVPEAGIYNIRHLGSGVSTGRIFNINLGGGLKQIDPKYIPENISIPWDMVKDKPFYEEGIKIEWDGDLTSALNIVPIEGAGGSLYQMTNEPISAEDIIGATFVCDDGSINGITSAITQTDIYIVDSGNPDSYIAFCNGTFPILMSAAEAETVSFLGVSVTLPSAGIWFIRADDGSNYTKSLDIGYSVKQIDPKYIPINLDIALGNYYNKAEIDGIVRNANSVLEDYYKKLEVYNKNEIDNIFISLDTALSNIVGSGVLS